MCNIIILFLTDDAPPDQSSSYAELIQSIQYTKYMSSLIGYSCQPKFIYLKVSDLNLLNQHILEFRPGKVSFFYFILSMF